VNAPLSFRSHVAALAWLLLAALLFTYPLVTAPTRANRLDSPDAMLNAWIVAWDIHQLSRDPRHLFDANIFFPEKGSLAFSENLVTGALLAAPAALFSTSPILLTNVALILAFVLTGYATFVLAYDVTGDRWAAALGGILFGFAPYRFAHLPHLQLELAFGIPMTLYFARRVLRERDFTASLGLAFAIPLTFGSSVYYSVYGATALPVLVAFELGRRAPGSRLRPAARLFAAGALGTLATLPLVVPYWNKLSAGTVRPLEAAARFSASAVDYVSSFSRLHAFLPNGHEPLFPGFVALALAALGLRKASGSVSPSTKRSWVAIGILGVLLSLGPKLGLFTVFYELLPPYRGLRVPSRAGVLFLLAVAVLAALGLSDVRSRWARASLVAVAAAECFAGPLSFSMEEPLRPAIYDQVEALEEDGALVVLPFPAPEHFQDNALYVYRSIRGFRPLVNGYSGFAPKSYRDAHRALVEGDLAAGLRGLSREGVRYVLAHEGRLGPRMIRQLQEAEQEGLLVSLAKVSGDQLYVLRDR
jgi:hypothetical protein